MIKNFKIYTDLNDGKTYAYCTYDLIRNRKLHTESFRIDLLFTDKDTPPDYFKPNIPVYDLLFTQTIESRQGKSDFSREPVVFSYKSYGYDQHTILEFIGDSPEHRDFLEQVGIHD
ncbi:hypothetical protein [Pseudomonas aeruginosa]|uniref:hypothetical protein n=1 Tax=Pseudomonas aeruginosa TaxID=287 RepID=UPI0022EBE8AB|nr:hypothetical protein [Pseudomonas aeruginosa]